jgi:hypothetical protein
MLVLKFLRLGPSDLSTSPRPIAAENAKEKREDGYPIFGAGTNVWMDGKRIFYNPRDREHSGAFYQWKRQGHVGLWQS